MEGLRLREGQAEAVIAELERRGYITMMRPHRHKGWELTLEGGGFALSSAAPPVTRATAQHHLDAFLERVAEVNRAEDLLHWCTEVWLFGSYPELLSAPMNEVYRRLKARSRVLSIHDADEDDAFQQSSARLVYRFEAPGAS